jgi:anti-sigma B factor antagonist
LQARPQHLIGTPNTRSLAPQSRARLSAVPAVAPFSIDAERSTDGWRVVVCGEVDLHVAPQLAAAIQRAEEERLPRIVVDLTQVPFLDSSGIGVLLAASKRVGRSRLTIVAPGREVRRVLELTGADRVLRVVDEDSRTR